MSPHVPREHPMTGASPTPIPTPRTSPPFVPRTAAGRSPSKEHRDE